MGKLKKFVKKIGKYVSPSIIASPFLKGQVKHQIAKQLEKALSEARALITRQKEYDKQSVRDLVEKKIKSLKFEIKELEKQLAEHKITDKQLIEVSTWVMLALLDCQSGSMDFLQELFDLNVEDLSNKTFSAKHSAIEVLFTTELCPLKIAYESLYEHRRSDAIQLLLPFYRDPNVSNENKNYHNDLKKAVVDRIAKPAAIYQETSTENEYMFIGIKQLVDDKIKKTNTMCSMEADHQPPNNIDIEKIANGELVLFEKKNQEWIVHHPAKESFYPACLFAERGFPFIQHLEKGIYLYRDFHSENLYALVIHIKNARYEIVDLKLLNIQTTNIDFWPQHGYSQCYIAPNLMNEILNACQWKMYDYKKEKLNQNAVSFLTSVVNTRDRQKILSNLPNHLSFIFDPNTLDFFLPYYHKFPSLYGSQDQESKHIHSADKSGHKALDYALANGDVKKAKSIMAQGGQFGRMPVDKSVFVQELTESSICIVLSDNVITGFNLESNTWIDVIKTNEENDYLRIDYRSEYSADKHATSELKTNELYVTAEQFNQILTYINEENAHLDELLCQAARMGIVEACHFFILLGANVNAQINNELLFRARTPLMWAIIGTNHPAIVSLLLKAGSNLYLTDTDKMTAWHHAFAAFQNFAESGTPLEIIEMMSSKGYDFDLTLKNAQGKTPFEIVDFNSVLMPMRLALRNCLPDINHDKCFNLPIEYFKQSKGLQKPEEEKIASSSWWDQLLNYLQDSKNINPADLCHHVGGCVINFMNEMPADLNQYWGQYIILENKKQLFYIVGTAEAKKAELIKINNLPKLIEDINPLRSSNKNSIAITFEQHELIFAKENFYKRSLNPTQNKTLIQHFKLIYSLIPQFNNNTTHKLNPQKLECLLNDLTEYEGCTLGFQTRVSLAIERAFSPNIQNFSELMYAYRQQLAKKIFYEADIQLKRFHHLPHDDLFNVHEEGVYSNFVSLGLNVPGLLPSDHNSKDYFFYKYTAKILLDDLYHRFRPYTLARELTEFLRDTSEYYNGYKGIKKTDLHLYGWYWMIQPENPAIEHKKPGIYLYRELKTPQYGAMVIHLDHTIEYIDITKKAELIQESWHNTFGPTKKIPALAEYVPATINSKLMKFIIKKCEHYALSNSFLEEHFERKFMWLFPGKMFHEVSDHFYEPNGIYVIEDGGIRDINWDTVKKIMCNFLISHGYFEDNLHPFREINFANTMFKARVIYDIVDYYENNQIPIEHYNEFIQKCVAHATYPTSLLNHLLLAAIQKNDMEMCKRVLENGAEIDCTIKFNKAFYKEIDSYSNFIKQIKFKMEPQIPLVRSAPPPASPARPKEIAEPFNEVTAKINLDWFDWRTPLMIAVASGNIELVLYLLNEGALVNCQTQEGWTALHEVAFLSRKDPDRAIQLLDILLMHGADPFIKATSNETEGSVKKILPLHLTWFGSEVFQRLWLSTYEGYAQYMCATPYASLQGTERGIYLYRADPNHRWLKLLHARVIHDSGRQEVVALPQSVEFFNTEVFRIFFQTPRQHYLYNNPTRGRIKLNRTNGFHPILERLILTKCDPKPISLPAPSPHQNINNSPMPPPKTVNIPSQDSILPYLALAIGLSEVPLNFQQAIQKANKAYANLTSALPKAFNHRKICDDEKIYLANKTPGIYFYLHNETQQFMVLIIHDRTRFEYHELETIIPDFNVEDENWKHKLLLDNTAIKILSRCQYPYSIPWNVNGRLASNLLQLLHSTLQLFSFDTIFFPEHQKNFELAAAHVKKANGVSDRCKLAVLTTFQMISQTDFNNCHFGTLEEVTRFYNESVSFLAKEFKPTIETIILNKQIEMKKQQMDLAFQIKNQIEKQIDQEYETLLLHVQNDLREKFKEAKKKGIKKARKNFDVAVCGLAITAVLAPMVSSAIVASLSIEAAAAGTAVNWSVVAIEAISKTVISVTTHSLLTGDHNRLHINAAKTFALSFFPAAVCLENTEKAPFTLDSLKISGLKSLVRESLLAVFDHHKQFLKTVTSATFAGMLGDHLAQTMRPKLVEIFKSDIMANVFENVLVASLRNVSMNMANHQQPAFKKALTSALIEGLQIFLSECIAKNVIQFIEAPEEKEHVSQSNGRISQLGVFQHSLNTSSQAQNQANVIRSLKLGETS